MIAEFHQAAQISPKVQAKLDAVEGEWRSELDRYQIHRDESRGGGMIEDLETTFLASLMAIGAAVIVYLVVFNLILSRSSPTKGP